MFTTIAIIILLVLIVLEIPIGFALIIASSIGLWLSPAGLMNAPIKLLDSTSNFVILALPLFILMGALITEAGIARRLIDLAQSLVGWMRGGLAHVNVVTNMFVAEISGSPTADAAMLGKIFVPEMAENGYPKEFAAAVTSAAAVIGGIIPPSISFIIYGAVTNTSVRDLFIAGIIPGILLGFLFMVVSYLYAVRKGFTSTQPFSVNLLLRATRDALIPLLIPILVVGGLIYGVFTPTEAAGVGVVIALGYGLATRLLTRQAFYRSLVISTHQSAAIMVIIAGAALFGQLLALEQVPQHISAFLANMGASQIEMLLLVNIVLLFVGLFLEPASAILIVVPLLYPIVIQYGIDPVHFGVMTVVNLAIGQQTPPTAPVLLTVCAGSNLRIGPVLTYMKYYLVAMVIALMLITFVPELSLWLV
ncbi:TRAP transporter large permease [Allopusillimonas ginsengisoli]|uniref:TRAP transporter large permease n=1 Tax=Allopusillimonas ginsengisoli TaxID=453575 RepID=UPI0010209377|nr:TRAP transporter large permease [Allopusillimonas ginsengisoli]TEA79999.1 TRAP transporter large permease [Allopusillimonas ginsengisoli]